MPRRYCIRCGRRLGRARERGRVVSRCRACGWIDWVNPAPTASVLIVRHSSGGRAARVLLVRRARAPARGAWDVPGGFVERGETGEQAARREVREELGVDVDIERFVGAFPDVYGVERVPSFNLYFAGRLRRRNPAIRAADDASGFEWFPIDRVPHLAFRNNRRALLALRRVLGRTARHRARPARARPNRRAPR